MQVQENQKVGNSEKDIPQKWCWVKHKDIATVGPKLPLQDISEATEVSFLSMSSVEAISGKYNSSQTRQYSEVKKGYTSFVNGDLIFAKITPCMENGKIALLDNLKNGIGFGSTEFHVSRLSHLTNRTYFFYYFNQESFRQNAKKNMTGSAGQLRVSKAYFENICIPFPPVKEQHRIVDKIEELFSDLDAGIESLKTARSQLKIYRQAVLKWAFEGKLTADWRQEQQRKGKLKSADELLAQIKIDREQHYQQQLKDWEAAVKAWESDDKVGKKPTTPQKINNVEQPSESDIFAFPPLPNEWGYIRAESISDFITKGTTPSKEELNNGHGDIPFVKVYNLTNNGTLDFSINPTFVSNETHRCFLSRSKVLPGDILMNIVGPPLGKVSLAPDIFNEWNINQAIARYRPLKIIFNKYLLHYLLFQGTIDRMSKKAKATVGQFNLTLEICRDIEVPICSKEEQYKIVEEIESRLSVCDNLETTIAENIQRAESLRQSILKQAFEGKLVPQDPNDEPAAHLLERIKQSKAAPQQPQQLDIPLAGTTSRRKTKPA